MAKTKKKSHFFLFLLITFIVFLIFRIILEHVVGSKGVAYFSLPNELFFLLGGFISFGIEEAVSTMVENRMKRAQYSNVHRVVSYAFSSSLGIGLLISFLIYIFAGRISTNLFSIPLSKLAVLAVAPAVLLYSLTGVFRGYFKGTNNRILTTYSYLIFAGAYLIFGTLFATIMKQYGVKVSKLLRVEDFQYAHGAIGASFGILCASFVAFAYVVVVYFVFRHRTSFEEGRESQRSVDYPLETLLNLLATALVPGLLWASFAMYSFINGAFFLHQNTEDNLSAFCYGEYYGKTFPITGIIVFALCIFTYPLIRKASGAFRRDEYRNSREKLKMLIHRAFSASIFMCGMVLVLSDNIVSFMFATNGEKTAEYLQLESLCIPFAVFAIIFVEMLISMRNYIWAFGITGLSLILHIVLCALFTGAFYGVNAVILSNLCFFALITVTGFFIISKQFQYTQEWFRTFIVSLVGAVLSALIGMLLNKAIAPLTGKGIATIIIFVVCTILYMVIQLALKGFSEDDLEDSFLGRFMISLGRMINLL